VTTINEVRDACPVVIRREMRLDHVAEASTVIAGLSSAYQIRASCEYRFLRAPPPDERWLPDDASLVDMSAAQRRGATPPFLSGWNVVRPFGSDCAARRAARSRAAPSPFSAANLGSPDRRATQCRRGAYRDLELAGAVPAARPYSRPRVRRPHPQNSISPPGS